MKKFYFDTHVHLDLYKDLDVTVKLINEYKSYTIAVTNLPILYEKALENTPNTKYIRIALGLHPELIHKFPEQIEIFFKKIKKARYIGEIGLDFSREYIQYKDLQIDFFRKCIEECDNLGGKVLSVHSRHAAEEIIDIIGPRFNGKIILHWYTGTKKAFKKAIGNGYYFSINPEMLKTSKGRDIIINIPLDRILIESDGPFSKNMQKKYEPSFVEEVIYGIANIREIEEDEINQLLKLNFKELLS